MIIEGDKKREESMAFEILKNIDHNVSARLGRLAIKGRKVLETPNFLAVSSRGVLPHMTPDVIIASTRIEGVHMALEDCEFVSIRKCINHVRTFCSSL
jgi:queuine tRNA-ribosyltransferase subunit QTRTD1